MGTHMEVGGILGIFFGVFFLIWIAMMIFAMKMRKRNLREKKEKKEQALKEERDRQAMELEKRRFEFELEKERASLTPIYCKYCGAKNDPDAKFCCACGAGLE